MTTTHSPSDCGAGAGRDRDAAARRVHRRRWSIVLAASAFAIVAALVATAVWRGAGERWPLEPGVWTGDVTRDGVVAGVRWEVRELAGQPRIRLVALPAYGLREVEMTGVHAAPGGLRFTWPGALRRYDRRCELARTEAGEYRGECALAGARSYAVRLIPPSAGTPPVGLAATLLAQEDAWTSVRRGAVEVHAPSSQGGAFDAAALAASAAARVSEALAILGEQSFDGPLHVFAVQDRAAMAEVVGRPVGGWADPLAGAVVVSGWGASEGVLRHEIMHVLTAQLWGAPAPPSAWLEEGLGTLAMGTCRGHSIDDLVRHAHDAGALPAFRALLSDFRAHDDLVSYLQSASIVDFLHRRHGDDALRRLWRRGVHAAAAELGEGSASQLEASWLARLVAGPRRVDAAQWRAVRDGGCG